MNKKINITIGRELGSGGIQIGKLLAKSLNIAFYDKKLIQLAAQENGLEKEIFEQADEQNGHSLFGSQFSFFSTFEGNDYSGNFLSNEKLFTLQSKVIQNITNEKSAVFVGRCADYVLKENSSCVNFFICADLNDRIKHVSKTHSISEKEAKELIAKVDKKRTTYYNYFSNKTWGDARSYHLCLNSSVLGINKTTALLLQFIKQKFDLD